MLVRDALSPVRSMADGKVYDSRSALYRSYQEQGVRIVEAGERPASPRSDITRSDVGEALRKVRGGYKPQPEKPDEDLPSDDNVVV